MSIALIHNHSKYYKYFPTGTHAAAGHPSLHHGKSAKNQQMETDGNYHLDWREDLPLFIIVGKRGKMRRKGRKFLTPGMPLAPVTWVKSDIR